jgi:molybdopterin converting factor small subunit
MVNQSELTLKLFGALRKYGSDSSVTLQLKNGSSISDLKKVLAVKLQELHPDFFDSAILDECAFATEDRVLLAQELVPQTPYIAVLPPVCGG